MIPPCPIPIYPRKKLISLMFINPLKILEGHNEVCLQTSLFQAEQALFPQPVFAGEGLQSLWPSSGPSPKTPHLSCAGAPDSDAVLHMGHHYGRTEGDNHIPLPAVQPSYDGTHDTVGLLCCMGI